MSRMLGRLDSVGGDSSEGSDARLQLIKESIATTKESALKTPISFLFSFFICSLSPSSQGFLFAAYDLMKLKSDCNYVARQLFSASYGWKLNARQI